MKKMGATAAAKNFGEYIDTVQREPVIITKKDRPVAVTYSIERAKELIDLEIEAGINSGLEDVKAGRTYEMTPEFKSNFSKTLETKYSQK